MIHRLTPAASCGIALSLGLSFSSAAALADDVDILAANASKTGETWTFSVTLEHADTGWDHYADLWQVETPEGEVLGQRVLLHPHVDEQPFTRSLSGVPVPEGLDHVIIRARDTVNGFSDKTFELELPE